MKLLTILLFFLVLTDLDCLAQKHKQYDAIYSGVPWYDDNGNIVSAHGANIVKEKDRFFLFGEAHSDTSNQFVGFNCYSSTDLYNWKFESVALPVQAKGKLGPNRVGERVKVMKCPASGEYIMYMHVDTLGYKDQFIGYATSEKIVGPYVFQGPILYDGKPIRKWDMGTFQDQDGSGYVLIHGGEIYKLRNDYKSVAEQVNKNMTPGFESPTLFRKDSIYYFLGSYLTSWEKNENYYYTATSLKGPWKNQGIFAKEGTLTWNSQTTFVLPINGSKDTTFLFMGDRWSYPKQASAATYVWQPLTVSGYSISIPEFEQAWQIYPLTGVKSFAKVDGRILGDSSLQIIYSGNWQNDTSGSRTGHFSQENGASFTIGFKGIQIGWYGLASPKGGYAKVIIRNRKGKIVLSSIVDLYCLYADTSLRYLSPLLSKGNYSLIVSVMGERPNWSDKKKNSYGSTGYEISLDKIVLKE
ncbi:family 43 glycosylhydrolase [Dyadobacter sp. CY345]|uniref:family 43 glycosylhydrolase n=1 Tax=Dyadobacter sp. CY345 TaxID=2909335 RepID=UPI001F28685B|nr:family 43 glycosylhydrolase [Dyadobacter sp. CY345]MCF2443349.1 family 43 glycosylhydrolase [Dyadobacter sp. CY345]